MAKTIRVLSDSALITKKIGAEFAGSLIKNSKVNQAPVITLRGDLGAGKTTFVLGFLSHFGIKPHAASPTFVIMKRYATKCQMPNSKCQIENIYHLDAYRLHSKNDLGMLGFDKILKNSKNIILIEWPEKIKGVNFKNRISVKFNYGKKENERVISFIK
jgi:tRNA threonylcarbamoyladenosine biosynthesis protein TsaE